MGRLVWYVSYGSNLDRDRFMCYIEGGRPECSMQREIGCQDKTPPRALKPVTIPFPLYFAKESSRWDNKGVAFIGLQRSETEQTLGRMYLIIEEQFIEVVRQENNNLSIPIDLEEVKKNGSKVFRKPWYGNIIYLGEEEGHPKFTFTASTEMGDEPFIAPLLKYMRTMISGLREVYDLPKTDLVKYLLEKPGIQGFYCSEKIEGLVNEDIYSKAALKYKPEAISVLFIAESPPAFKSQEKMSYFYFEENPGADILFATLIKAIYSEDYRKSPVVKRDFLKRLKVDGYFLIDAVPNPINKDRNGNRVPDKTRKNEIIHQSQTLLCKLKHMWENGIITPDTKVILIKATVHDALAGLLRQNRFNIMNQQSIGFPRYYRDKDVVSQIETMLGK